jgi:hypothetical protein
MIQVVLIYENNRDYNTSNLLQKKVCVNKESLTIDNIVLNLEIKKY